MLMMARNDQTNGKSLLIGAEMVAVMTGVSVRQVNRWAIDGILPKPVRLPGVRRWRRAEIEQWIAKGCPPTRRVLRK